MSFPNPTFTCSICGKETSTDDAVPTATGYVCPKCAETEFDTCDKCGSIVRQDSLERVGPEDTWWCEECRGPHAFYCDRCQKWYDHSLVRGYNMADTGEILCEDHYLSADGFLCGGCDQYFTGQRYAGSDDDYSYCDECYVEPEDEDEDENEEEEGPISAYHRHTRRWNKWGESKSGIYFGVELEAVSEPGRWDFHEAAENLEVKFGEMMHKGVGVEFLFTELDGSLREDPTDYRSRHRGFEVIFHPMAPEWISGHEHVFKKILGLLQRGHMVSYKANEQGLSAGMHVTFNWQALGRLAQVKFLRLLYGNPKMTALVSRRTKKSLERYSEIKAPARPPAMVLRKAGYEVKHVAVHLKSYLDKKTSQYLDLAEVRIFRGTLKFESFMMNLEFVMACVAFARSSRRGLRDMTADNLMAYIGSRKKRYPRIHAWLVEKGQIK